LVFKKGGELALTQRFGATFDKPKARGVTARKMPFYFHFSVYLVLILTEIS
jgi:hypothetical protein